MRARKASYENKVRTPFQKTALSGPVPYTFHGTQGGIFAAGFRR